MELSYIIEWADDCKLCFFETDEDAITYAENNYNGSIRILKSTYYEDQLASGFYWSVIWEDIVF